MITLNITISTPAIEIDVKLDVAQTGIATPIDLAHGSEELYNP